MDKFVVKISRTKTSSNESECVHVNDRLRTRSSTSELDAFKRLQNEARKIGFAVIDVPRDGNCALHAIIEQLHYRECSVGCDYSVDLLRKEAVDYIENHVNMLEKASMETADGTPQQYLKKQRANGTWLDERMLRAVVEILNREVRILHHTGYTTVLKPVTTMSEQQLTQSQLEHYHHPLWIGLIEEMHYVSLHVDGDISKEHQCKSMSDKYDDNQANAIIPSEPDSRVETSRLKVNNNRISGQTNKSCFKTETYVQACNAGLDLTAGSETDQKRSVSLVEDLVDSSTNYPSSDFGHIVQQLASKRTSAEADIGHREMLLNRWTPSRADEFPVSYHLKNGKQRPRRLLQCHLDSYKWLAVSRLPGCAGAWCVYCVLFKTSNTGGSRSTTYGFSGNQFMGALVNKPLVNFSKLTGQDGCLGYHEQTKFHQTCAIRATEFLQRTESNSKNDVRFILNKHRQDEMQKNRLILRPIIDTVILCALQNIPFRGHRDDGNFHDLSTTIAQNNEGNFRALLRFRVNSGDKNLEAHLLQSRKNARYTSKTIQNELLTIIAEIIQKDVVKDVKSAVFWSLLADETTDSAKREQLVITVRYVSKSEGVYVIKEEPVSLVDVIQEQKTNNISVADCENVNAHNNETNDSDAELPEIKLDGLSIGSVIKGQLLQLNLDFGCLIGQGYDGASTMSSERVGVASVIKQSAPLADYFHCSMHALNLSCERAVRVAVVRHAQDLVRECTQFFSHSAKRTDYLKRVISNKAPGASKTRLMTLCTTRFVERHVALITFWELLPYVIAALECMVKWDGKTGSQALLLLNSILKFDFLVGIVCLRDVSALLRPLSVRLQERGIDLVAALQDIDTALNVLKKWRQNSENEFNDIYRELMDMALSLNINASKPRASVTSVFRSNATKSNDNKNGDSIEDYYRINVYFPMLDEIIQDLSQRFQDHQRISFSLCSLLPHKVSTTSWEEISGAVEKYAMFLDPSHTLVKAEYTIWKQYWLNKLSVAQSQETPKTAIEALNACPCTIYPNIHKLIAILATLPVSTAEPERIFSKVKSTLCATRSTMNEERLEALVLLQAHRNRVININIDKIIDAFAVRKTHRLKF